MASRRNEPKALKMSTTLTDTILPTRNPDWGYWGTMACSGVATPGSGPGQAGAAEAWAIAFRRIAEATGAAPEGVRDFLDSRHGRHFADGEPANATGSRERANGNGLCKGEDLAAAIDGAIARWMGWRIDRHTARKTGIPAGLPSLTGWVTHFAILDEMSG
jgi:hypothetical protein